MSKRPSKEEVFWKVLSAAVELDFKKGHLKWTLSDLSRQSGVTRSLIYYYFGRSKMAILKEAVKLIGDELIGMSEERMNLWKSGDFVESMLKTRQINDKAPFICAFTMAHMNKPKSELGQSLKIIEMKFIKKLSQFFPAASPERIRAMYAFYFGLTFSPGVDEASIAAAFEMLIN